MALLFNYSFNNLTLAAQLPGALANISGSPTIGVADGPGTTAINTLHTDGKNSWGWVPNVGIPINSQGFGIGCGFNVTAFGSAATNLYAIGSSGSSNFAGALLLQLGADGSLQCWIAGQIGTFFSSPSGTFTFGSRHEVEMIISSFSSTASVTVKLDGVAVTGLTSMAFNLTAYLPDGPTIHSIAFGGSNAFFTGGTVTSTPIVCDSIYAIDTTGSAPCNALLGPCISIPYIPSGVGHVSGFSVFGESFGWQALAVIPPAGDTSYIYSATPTTQESCALTGPSDITAVYGLSVIANQRQDTAGGGRTTSLGIGNGSSQNYPTFFGTWPLGTSYKTNTTPISSNPFTSAPWALADLSTLEVAVKVAS